MKQLYLVRQQVQFASEDRERDSMCSSSRLGRQASRLASGTASHSCRDSARKHLCNIVYDHIFRTTLMLYITRNLGHDNLRPVFTSAEYARLSNDRFKTRSLADDTKVHFLLILTSVAPSQIIKPLHLECSEQETFWKHRDQPKASS